MIPDKHPKHWIWITSPATNPDSLYNEYASANVRGLFFEFDDETQFRAARQNNLETHRWIWTLNVNDEALMEAHPEWYAVNRNGKSCAVSPPYVDYYRWLCPNREEVRAYLEQKTRSILEKDYVDGIHLDYIRYCDVILPVNLWSKYGLVQTQELGEFDFCYCEVCRNDFKKIKGVDPLQLQYPDQNLSWRKFRYDSITRLVNSLYLIAQEYKKEISAAVFPTPEVAKRLVRQDWANWNLHRIFPMLYHGFYQEDVSWIGTGVKEGTLAISQSVRLYAGLFLPDFKSMEELKAGIHESLANGADGISLFGHVDAEIIKLLKGFR
jgi:uncharacterized lipoprotein YddW (UPF0748 family)